MADTNPIKCCNQPKVISIGLKVVQKNILVTQLEGPYNDNDKLIEKPVDGEKYWFKATFNRDAEDEEYKRLNWQMVKETGETLSCNVDYKNMKYDGNSIKVQISCHDMSLYAFFGERSEKVKVQCKTIGRSYILLYTQPEGNTTFKTAAQARKKEIETASYFNKQKDFIVLEEIKDLASIAKLVEKQSKQQPTKEFYIWSDMTVIGPAGTVKTSSGYHLQDMYMTWYGWEQIKFNWLNDGKGATACLLGSIGSDDKDYVKQKFTRFSNFKNVTVEL